MNNPLTIKEFAFDIGALDATQSIIPSGCEISLHKVDPAHPGKICIMIHNTANTMTVPRMVWLYEDQAREIFNWLGIWLMKGAHDEDA